MSDVTNTHTHARRNIDSHKKIITTSIVRVDFGDVTSRKAEAPHREKGKRRCRDRLGGCVNFVEPN